MSEDLRELVRETVATKIEFHNQYWKNVSKKVRLPLDQSSSLLMYRHKNSS